MEKGFACPSIEAAKLKSSNSSRRARALRLPRRWRLQRPSRRAPAPMPSAVTFVLNGRPVCIEDFSPSLTLLEYLRGHGLTGAKEGCAEGDCGACSVVMIDRDARGRRLYRAINSCLVPVSLIAGREIVTVEGVANHGLHPVQEQLARGHGSQCGYCTPGMIMAAAQILDRNPDPTTDEIRHGLEGNLCRCTGYDSIVAGVLAARAKRIVAAISSRTMAILMIAVARVQRPA